MADVTTTFAAKDESFAKTVDKLQGRLTGFSGGVESFNSKVAGMASSFAKFAGPIAGVATAFFGAKAAVEAFGSALAMGGRLDDLSKRTGASAGEMLLLEKAFELAGSSAEAVGPTISKLNRFLAESSVAGSAQDETLRGLGLSYQRLAELSPTEQMKLLAERIAGIQNPAMQTQAAMAVFGKTGGELIPLLTDFSGELSKARGFLGSLPGIMSENAAAFADLDENIREVRNKFDQFVAGLITGLVPALTSVTDKMANLDAAGLGKAFSGFITSALQAVSNSYLLGDAIDNVKTAIEAIVSGNYSEGLSLMWVTMKITALNAVNEVVKNFIAGLQTIGNFIATMFDPSGALIMLIQSIGTIVSSSLLSKIGSGLADLLSGLGPMFASAAESARYNAETASRSVEMNMKSLGSQIELVGEQAGDAGKALPAEFAKNKSKLNPLFDLTDEFAEQERLQKSINKEIAKAQPPAEAVATAATEYASALGDAKASLQSTVDLSGDLFTNLNKATMGAQNVGAAFELGPNATGKMALDMQNTSANANQATEWMSDVTYESGQLSLNGSNFEASTAAAAGNVKGAKMDAKITSDTYTGMSDRMAKGANAVDQTIDKMREVHHFGQRTQEEIYNALRDGGQSIYDATKNAGKEFADQSQASTDMRKMESKALNSNNKKDRAMDRAARLEANGQDGAANSLRRRTEAKFAKEMKEILPADKGAKDELKVGADALADAVNDKGGGGGAGHDPVLSAVNAIEKFLSKTFFDDFKKRLPQNAMS